MRPLRRPRRPPLAAQRARDRLALGGDNAPRGADRRDLPFADDEAREHARGRSFDFDLSLVGFDGEYGFSLANCFSLACVPLNDRSCGRGMAELGQLDYERHCKCVP